MKLSCVLSIVLSLVSQWCYFSSFVKADYEYTSYHFPTQTEHDTKEITINHVKLENTEVPANEEFEFNRTKIEQPIENEETEQIKKDEEEEEKTEEIKHLTQDEEIEQAIKDELEQIKKDEEEENKTEEIKHLTEDEEDQPSIIDEKTELIKEYEETELIRKNEEDEPIKRDEEEEPIKRDEEEEPIKKDEEDEPIKKDEEDEPIKRDEEEEPIKKDEEEEPTKRDEEEEPIKKDEEEEDKKEDKKECVTSNYNSDNQMLMKQGNLRGCNENVLDFEKTPFQVEKNTNKNENEDNNKTQKFFIQPDWDDFLKKINSFLLSATKNVTQQECNMLNGKMDKGKDDKPIENVHMTPLKKEFEKTDQERVPNTNSNSENQSFHIKMFIQLFTLIFNTSDDANNANNAINGIRGIGQEIPVNSS